MTETATAPATETETAPAPEPAADEVTTLVQCCVCAATFQPGAAQAVILDPNAGGGLRTECNGCFCAACAEAVAEAYQATFVPEKPKRKK